MENRNTLSPENSPPRIENQPSSDTDFMEDETIETAGETTGVGNVSELGLGEDPSFDRVVGPEEAGLGSGLDQAEEARLGITDEELAELARGTPKN
jgi:hypothetical protein